MRQEYLRNVCLAVCFDLECSTTIGSQPLWAFRFALYAKRLDGSKCRDCDTRQMISSTARAVTPVYWCALRPGTSEDTTGESRLCPHLLKRTLVSRLRRSVAIAGPGGSRSYELQNPRC